MSISTKHGDKGLTGLVGGTRISKADLRVDAYGTLDELGAGLGFARSICDDAEVRELVKEIQRELFAVSGSVANPRAREKDPPDVTAAMVERLTAEVARIENMDGIISDWVIPGDHAAAAALDVARTVCRRAERLIVALEAQSEAQGEALGEFVIPYINRLSDLIWLYGRLLEMRAGVDPHLRDDTHKGANWSRAW